MSNEKSQSVDGEQEVVFPAADLKAAREREGLSLKDVARELRLSEKYIDALERAAFEELPSMVFARGYIRSYTKLLRLDVERYLAVFDELYGRGTNTSAMRSASTIEQQAKLGDPVIKWSAWLFVIVVVAASFWWWKSQQVSEDVTNQFASVQPIEVESADGSTVIVEPAPVVVTEPSEGVDSDPVEPEKQLSSDDEQLSPVEEGGDEGVVAVSEEQVSVISSAQQDQVESEQNGTDDQLEIAEITADTAETLQSETESSETGPTGTLWVSFNDECWVSVEDSKGKMLAMRVKPAGSELNVSGSTPFKVLLGKASAVDKVLFDGNPVNIDRSSRSGVVRLTLPETE